MGKQHGSKDRPSDAAEKADKREIDEDLTEALKETFPASDPAAVGRPSAKPDRPEHRRTPVIDLEEVRRLARKVK
jgi:hypothetical protein